MSTLLLLLLSLSARAESFLTGDWKVNSFRMEAGVGAWGTDEARALVKKRVAFRKAGIRLGGTSCGGSVKALELSETKSLLSGMKGPYCGKGHVKPEVYSVDLSCGDKARFTPYVARLTNGDYLAFGDGITFCLGR